MSPPPTISAPTNVSVPTEFAAVDAVLTVDREGVTITRKEAGGRVRVRNIALSSIRAVELKRPGMTPGYLRLCTGRPLPAGVDLAYVTGGGYDDDTLVLSRKHYATFEEAGALIEELIERRRVPSHMGYASRCPFRMGHRPAYEA